MIERYQRDVMKKLWQDENKFSKYLVIEKAASYAWYQLGLFSKDIYEKIEKASFKLEDIYTYEAKTKHDVIAFTKAVMDTLQEEKKYLHYGLTSTDVVDSAYGLLLKETNQIIIDDILSFMKVLKQKAILYKDLPVMGRTHGMHAEVTSFGLKFGLWYEDFKRLLERFRQAAKDVEVCKISGAVGNYSANTPELEKIASKKLGLESATISTQTLQRDRHANYIGVIAQIGAELEKIAVEIRHLSRTEVKEVSEPFSQKQRGSSAMPHKKNPISSENISGLARLLRGYMIASYESIALWHERDISHSSVERITLVDATSLIDYMLNRYVKTIDNLVVFENKMLENIHMSYGIFYAQNLLHILIDEGFDRDDTYVEIQHIAYQAQQEKVQFLDLIKANPKFSKFVNSHKLTLNYYLRYVDEILNRIFN
ncbi:adenylosuccinate lyase [Mycoplasmatota bacterium]|nr:adenylosuccinate lyase [Mycoplasmatota bacterium]